MTGDWRARKCEDGCECGRHKTRSCPSGCVCSRHTHEFKKVKCSAGCTCARHVRAKCVPDCTCNRHRRPHNRYTAEQREEARNRRLARMREYMRTKRQEDPERFRTRATSTQQRGYTLKYRHGITAERWEGLYLAQDGCCYLCGDAVTRSAAHLDHDHDCCPGNKACGSCVRGLACQLCNQGIGQFGDDPERMRRAADALELANRRLRTRV